MTRDLSVGIILKINILSIIDQVGAGYAEMKCFPHTWILGNFGLAAFVLRSASVYEQTFRRLVICVCFALESGHPKGGH